MYRYIYIHIFPLERMGFNPSPHIDMSNPRAILKKALVLSTVLLDSESCLTFHCHISELYVFADLRGRANHPS